jgi:tetratricopeptide (TPR) repeat protein
MTISRQSLLSVLGSLALLGTASCINDTISRQDRAKQIEIHTDSASLNLAMGEYLRAESQALKGLDLDDDNFTLTLYLGRALLNQGTIEKILQAEYALRKLPLDEDFRVPLSLAEVLERKGIAFSEAAEGVASGERYTPAPDPSARAKELRQDSNKCFKESLELFEYALDMQPGDTEVLNGLVRITASLQLYGDSLAWGEALVRITRTDRLWFREQVDRPNVSTQDEERFWRVITRLRSLERSVHLHSAAILNLKLDQPEEALAALDAVLEFDPGIAEVYSQRAQLLVKLGRYEEAIASIDSFLSLASLEFDHPNVQRAFRIRRDCEAALVRSEG